MTSRYNNRKAKSKSVVLHLIVGILLTIALIIFFVREPPPSSRQNTLLKSKTAKSKQEISNEKSLRITSKSSTVANKINIPTKIYEKNNQSVIISPRNSSSSNDNVTPILEQIQELFTIGSKDPMKLFQLLQLDPFQTAGGPTGFICPNDHSHSKYLTIPDLRNKTRSDDFKKNLEGTWLFFQHLRKAGGTAFCDLASSNMKRSAIPSYYCMPDQRGSLATPPWNNHKYLIDHMVHNGYRIAANEWDAFYTIMWDLPGAVMATSIRDPVDRWYSQYRFEHLEHRDQSKPQSKPIPFRSYYNSMRGWTMTSNYYVKTFIGQVDVLPTTNLGDFYWTYRKYEKKKITWDMFYNALQNFLKFHIILVLEWIDSAPILLEDSLGWKVPPKQVLPHEGMAPRAIKKSVTAASVLSPDDYEFMIRDNIFDLLLFSIAKRIYLERLLCKF